MYRIVEHRRNIRICLKNVVTTPLMESNRPESDLLRLSERNGLRTPLDTGAIPILSRFIPRPFRSRSGKHTPTQHTRWRTHAHVCRKPTKDDLNYARPLTATRANSPTRCTGWYRRTNRRFLFSRFAKTDEYFVFDVTRAVGSISPCRNDVFETIDKFFPRTKTTARGVALLCSAPRERSKREFSLHDPRTTTAKRSCRGEN